MTQSDKLESYVADSWVKDLVGRRLERGSMEDKDGLVESRGWMWVCNCDLIMFHRAASVMIFSLK